MIAFRVVQHKIPCQHIREYPRATAVSQEDTLYLDVKQYIPLSNPEPSSGDVTILAATANGFPKELYEPLWEDLEARIKTSGTKIRSIWIADVAQQGASGVLNEQLIGNDPSWYDHARDLLHMVNLKRAEMPRPIFGLGHSMGGNQITKLALIHPRLFTSLILVDPVIQEKPAEIDSATPKKPSLVQLSTFRRVLWPSREEAAVIFKKSTFYEGWDSRVVEKWVQFGLRDVPTALLPAARSPQVTLTTTSAQEVFTFLRPNYQAYGVNGRSIDRDTHADVDPSRKFLYPFYRAEIFAIYDQLPEVRPGVLYIFGEKSNVSLKSWNDEKVKRTGAGTGGSGGKEYGRVKGVTLSGIGHLIPMEAPQRTADEIVDWIDVEVARFKNEEKAWEQWSSQPLMGKQRISDEWHEMIGGNPKAKI